MHKDLPERIGIIGCGTMGRALVEGILRHSIYPAGLVYIFDRDPMRTRMFRGVQQTTNTAELVYNTGIIFLCVRPQEIEDAMRGTNLEDRGLVSLCAGVRSSDLRANLRGCERVMRVMPNLGMTVDESATAYQVPNTLSPLETERVLNVFRSLGRVEPVSEEQMDAVTGISGSGPAYFLTVMDALAKVGEEAGMTYDSAMRLIAQTAVGTSALVRNGAKVPQLLRAVSSGGGTTEAAASILKHRNVRDAFIKAAREAADRAAEIGGDAFTADDDDI